MRLLAPLISAVLLAACGGQDRSPETEADAAASTPDTVLLAQRIYTGNPDQPLAGGVVYNAAGRITQVLPVGSAGPDNIEDFTVTDVGAATVFPGFVDAHVHLRGIGEREITLNLEGTASIDELVTRLEAEVQGKTAGSIVYGRGWIETGWPEGRMPTAADLDTVASGYPVILVRSDGHALVANAAALEAAGITDATPDPEGGKIERDAAGKATGILIDMAMSPAFALLAEPDDAAVSNALAIGAKVYASRGWTGVHNMSVEPREAALMQTLDGAGELPLRIHNSYDVEGFDIAAEHRHETYTVQNRAVKIYMDGALGSRGALLIAPYADRPDTSGLALMEPDQLDAVMQRAKDADVQLAIHAIGDLANRRILDAFEKGGYGVSERWRIEHTQVLAPEDIARVGADGLIASMQPSHAIGDLKFAPARLGLQRLGGAYAWKSLLDSGAVIAGGSDAPVEVGSPLIEFYAAVARKALDGTSGDGWHPEQALTREQALALFTTAPAYAAFQENELGTIEVGKIADFTVFDRDLMTVPEAEILEAQPVMTVLGGETVWRAD